MTEDKRLERIELGLDKMGGRIGATEVTLQVHLAECALRSKATLDGIQKLGKLQVIGFVVLLLVAVGLKTEVGGAIVKLLGLG